MTVQAETPITAFITDWFARFDRLDPPEAFLRDLHPQVVWDTPDADPDLSGHARFRAWYAAILDTFERPTEHYISDIAPLPGGVQFDVQLKARTKAGERVELRARENWTYTMRDSGEPLITHYSATLLD